MSAKICALFDEILKEGKVYSLANFHVRKYGPDDSHRAVRFENHIYFANHTRLIELEADISSIAPWSFDLFELHDISKFVNDNRFLIGKNIILYYI